MFGIDQLAAKIAAGFIAVIIVFSYGYYKGHSAVQSAFNLYRAEVTAAAEQQTKEVAKTNAKNEQRIKETKDAYNTSLANLRIYYGMRIAKGGGSMPKISGTTSGADEYSPDNLPAPVILAAQCAETTLTLVKLQEFVKQSAD